jgi:hypothetical protein
MSEKVKICKKCAVSFIGPRCPECTKLSQKKYRELNKEKVKALNVDWQSRNKEKVKACKAAWRDKNKEKMKAYKAAWRAKNKEKISVHMAIYISLNKEKRKANKAGHVSSLSNCYVACALCMKVSDVSKDLMELKREQLQVYRLKKQFKAALTEISKGEKQ